MNTQTHYFSGIQPFRLTANYCSSFPKDTKTDIDQHIHAECEIYVNVTGDVSFMVENTVYPISPGSIIISRPYEYHHCIYNSNALHKHFWILFSPGGNEELLKPFFDRKKGKRNLCICPPQRTEELFSLCRELSEKQYEPAKKYKHFFQLTDLISEYQVTDNGSTYADQSDPLNTALRYLNANFKERLSVSELAKAAHVSVNTLERHFQNGLGISPIGYLRQRRLFYATQILCNGASVEQTAEQSGFFDVSHFIAEFKKSYGVTPLQYRKNVLKK